MPQKAIIAGASGLIGSYLAHILLEHEGYGEVVALVRKPLPLRHNNLTQLVIDFEKLDDYCNLINGHAIFCCLGSTKRKTPDLKMYRRVDHDYPVRLAQMAVKNDIAQYHIVSAIGADASSSNYYTRMKGETESDLKAVGIKSLHIYQPSILTGNRKEFRLAEWIGIGLFRIINPLLFGKFSRYKSIAAKTVAMAMFKVSLTNHEGIFIYPSDKIKQLA